LFYSREVLELVVHNRWQLVAAGDNVAAASLAVGSFQLVAFAAVADNLDPFRTVVAVADNRTCFGAFHIAAAEVDSRACFHIVVDLEEDILDTEADSLEDSRAFAAAAVGDSQAFAAAAVDSRAFRIVVAAEDNLEASVGRPLEGSLVAFVDRSVETAKEKISECQECNR
jgi:hypothetical protein